MYTLFLLTCEHFDSLTRLFAVDTRRCDQRASLIFADLDTLSPRNTVTLEDTKIKTCDQVALYDMRLEKYPKTVLAGPLPKKSDHFRKKVGGEFSFSCRLGGYYLFR